MDFLRLASQKVSNSLTHIIARRWGDHFPFYCVAEYPKSGGTWLAQMLADYLQLPFPRDSYLPIACPAVLHTMWTYDPKLHRVSYIYRDGRDIMVSLFYDRLRVARHGSKPARKRVGRVYERLLGKNYDPEQIVSLLPRFIEFEFSHPGRGSRVSWSDHVRQWLDSGDSDQVAFLSYEQLLTDCAETVRGVVEKITGTPVDPWRLESTVEKFSMERQTGRRRGQEDPTQHVRKGVAGDWINYFSQESAEVFDHLAGDLLVRLGYEADRSWVDRCR